MMSNSLHRPSRQTPRQQPSSPDYQLRTMNTTSYVQYFPWLLTAMQLPDTYLTGLVSMHMANSRCSQKFTDISLPLFRQWTPTQRDGESGQLLADIRALVLMIVAPSLQLSTSINMPFNPYRPHRYPDSINRSRFPVSVPQPGMRTMSSNPLPSNPWTTPIIQNVVYQNGYTPTPQSTFIPQKPHVPAIHTGKLARSVELESSYFRPCFTPDESNHDQWSAGKTFGFERV